MNGQKPVRGPWKLLERNDPRTLSGELYNGSTVWKFDPSTRWGNCGRLFVYEGGVLTDDPLPYVCDNGSITVARQSVFGSEEDFDWNIRIYHYRLLEEVSLMLRLYDIRNTAYCRTTGWADCVVKCCEVLLFEPYKEQATTKPAARPRR